MLPVTASFPDEIVALARSVSLWRGAAATRARSDPAWHVLRVRTSLAAGVGTVTRWKGVSKPRGVPGMVFKLGGSAARTWRLLNGAKLLPEVIGSVSFINGEKPEKTAA